MNRRHFIEKASIIGAAPFLPLEKIELSKKPKYKLGYQLFSIRDEMDKAPLETLKVLKKMGYQDFESYGYGNEEDTFYGFPSKDLKKILEDMELSISSGHFGFAPYLDKSDDELRKYVDQCIIGAKNLGMSYITWPWIAPEQRNIETFKKMVGKLNLIGEKVTAANLGFAYHNHGFEFEKDNGEYGYDIIMKNTDPDLVKLQIDMYWVMHSSDFTPADLIKRQPGRFVMWHIKDMDKKTRDYTELGNGSIDYTKLLPDPTESGLEFYFIEQGGNYAHNSTKSAEDSATYFKKHLQHFL